MPLSSYLRTVGSHAQRVYTRVHKSFKGVEMVAHDMPRIRFIFPGSTKFNVLICLTTGHKNCTSPPPSGEEPRFFIWGFLFRYSFVQKASARTRSSRSETPNS